jgi:hypothetical protein
MRQDGAPDLVTAQEPEPGVSVRDFSEPEVPVRDFSDTAKLPKIDISEQGDSKAVSEVTGQDLLRFARHILLCLFALSCAVMLLYYFSDRKGTNEVAAKEIFEVIKVGVLPLVSLVIGFYFRKSEK